MALMSFLLLVKVGVILYVKKQPAVKKIMTWLGLILACKGYFPVKKGLFVYICQGGFHFMPSLGT